MSDIRDVFEIDTGENCICEDCGETKRLQFGVCMECGGKVVDIDEDPFDFYNYKS